MGSGYTIQCNHCGKERKVFFERGFLSEYKVLYNPKTNQLKNIGINLLDGEKNKNPDYLKYQKLLSKEWIEIENFEQLELYLEKIKCDTCKRNGYAIGIMEIFDWD